MDLLDVVALYLIFFYSDIKYPPYSKRIPLNLPLFTQSDINEKLLALRNIERFKRYNLHQNRRISSGQFTAALTFKVLSDHSYESY